MVDGFGVGGSSLGLREERKERDELLREREREDALKRNEGKGLTNSTAPKAFQAQTFSTRNLPFASFSLSPPAAANPPSNPPSPSIVLFATISTNSHSLSSANESASLLAASPSLGSSSKARSKHLEARMVSGGER